MSCQFAFFSRAGVRRDHLATGFLTVSKKTTVTDTATDLVVSQPLWFV